MPWKKQQSPLPMEDHTANSHMFNLDFIIKSDIVSELVLQMSFFQLPLKKLGLIINIILSVAKTCYCFKTF